MTTMSLNDTMDDLTFTTLSGARPYFRTEKV